MLKVWWHCIQQLRKSLRWRIVDDFLIIRELLKKTKSFFLCTILSLTQHFVKTVQFSSNTGLLNKKLRLFGFHFQDVWLKLITNSIESFPQNTDAGTSTTSAFSTFLIIIHDDAWTGTGETVMTGHHQGMTEGVDLFDSTKVIVRRHDGEERKDGYILSLKKA